MTWHSPMDCGVSFESSWWARFHRSVKTFAYWVWHSLHIGELCSGTIAGIKDFWVRYFYYQRYFYLRLESILFSNFFSRQCLQKAWQPWRSQEVLREGPDWTPDARVPDGTFRDRVTPQKESGRGLHRPGNFRNRKAGSFSLHHSTVAAKIPW